MKQIVKYFLYFTPKGNGFVQFQLADENDFRTTDPLTASEFSALVAVLTHKNICFDEDKNLFVSSS